MFENNICLLASKQFRPTMLRTIRPIGLSIVISQPVAIAVGLNQKFLEKKINNAK